MSVEPHDPEKWQEFSRDLESLINRYSKENGSDTPDFILAEYLRDCLHAWNAAMLAREKWYGRKCGNGAAILSPASSETQPSTPSLSSLTEGKLSPL